MVLSISRAYIGVLIQFPCRFAEAFLKAVMNFSWQVADIEKAERDKMRGKVEAIIGHGINCFVNRQLIYNFPEEIFADAGVMAIEHADFDGIERLALVTGVRLKTLSYGIDHLSPTIIAHPCLACVEALQASHALTTAAQLSWQSSTLCHALNVTQGQQYPVQHV